MKGDKSKMQNDYEFDLFDFSPCNDSNRRESSSKHHHDNIAFGVLLNPPIPGVPVTPAVLTPGTPVDFTIGYGHCTIANGANDAIVILKPSAYRISGTIPVNGVVSGVPGATVTIVLGLYINETLVDSDTLTFSTAAASITATFDLTRFLFPGDRLIIRTVSVTPSVIGTTFSSTLGSASLSVIEIERKLYQGYPQNAQSQPGFPNSAFPFPGYPQYDQTLPGFPDRDRSYPFPQ